MKRLKKPLITILLIFIVSLLITSTYESIYTNILINNFTSRGELVYTQGNQRFFLVKKEYDYEDTSRRIIESYDNNNIGYKGDIFLTSRNPVPNSITTKIISNHLWIGHSAIVINEDASQTIEITGNDVNNNNFVRIWDNTWYDDLILETLEYAVIRVKNINNETIDNVINTASEKINKPYNYSFIFNTKNSYYCTDLVSRSYLENGIKIDYDGLTTTGSDMILSKNTYLIYYRKQVRINSEIFYNIYYLGD